MVCSICYERFTAPVALPCGHIFCRECIRRTVDASQICAVQHFCPTCRAGYNVVTIDPALVPAYMRPHILPTLRPVFFDDPALDSATFEASDCGSSSERAAPAPAKPTDHHAETHALRLSCTTWRRRAEVHAAANAGLLGFARAAKEYTLCMRAERDEALSRCAALERRLAALLLAAELDPLAPQGRVQHADLPERAVPPAQFSDDFPTPSPSVRRPDSSLDIHPILAHVLAGPSDAPPGFEPFPPATVSGSERS